MMRTVSRSARKLKLSYPSAILLALVGLAALYVWLTIAQMQQEALDSSLMSSIQAGFSAEAIATLRSGASSNARDTERKPEGFFNSLLRLLHIKPQRVETGDPALILALDLGERDVARELLARGADVKAKGREGRTTLMVAAEKGYADIVRNLLEWGVDLHAMDNDRTTTLMYALRGGNREIIQTILARSGDLGTQIKTVNLNGEDLLMSTALGGDEEAVRLLLDKGAAVNTSNGWTGMMPLHYAAIAGRTQAVKLLLDHGANVKARDRFGETPLILAAREYPEIVQLLLEKGADPNVFDTSGQTPLAVAAFSKTHSVVTMGLLLAKGAKIDLRATGGGSVLMQAIGMKRMDLVKFLLAHGADPNVKNAQGETPLSYALKAGYEEIVAVLKTAGTKR